MTEEEKKAIKWLKELYDIEKDFNSSKGKEESNIIKTLLNLIEKNQKEIKELNLENQAFYEEMNCDDNEYISKKYSQLKSVVEILANGIRVLGTNPDITTEEIIKEFTEKPITEEYMKKFKSGYISKNEVLKALGYEENDEEYDRLEQDDEKLLAILDTLYSEVCRLEDIEDQKVSVAVAFIEEKKDKYWQDKINNKIKELEQCKKEELQNDDDLGTHSMKWAVADYVIEVLKELIKEE